MVRSGLANPKEYRETLTSTIGGLMLRTGRKWRSLEDTAWHLICFAPAVRTGTSCAATRTITSRALWLQADAIIRQRTDGTHSLDDFCRQFLGRDTGDGDLLPYDVGEIVRLLKATADFDWERFLNERISRPLDALPLDLVGRLATVFSTHPTRRTPPATPVVAASISAQHSLGLTFSGDGQILDIVPGMAGDKARLAPGMKVMGINGRLFSVRRLQDDAGRQHRSPQDRIALAGRRPLQNDRARLRRRAQIPCTCAG